MPNESQRNGIVQLNTDLSDRLTQNGSTDEPQTSKQEKKKNWNEMKVSLWQELTAIKKQIYHFWQGIAQQYGITKWKKTKKKIVFFLKYCIWQYSPTY